MSDRVSGSISGLDDHVVAAIAGIAPAIASAIPSIPTSDKLLGAKLSSQWLGELNSSLAGVVSDPAHAAIDIRKITSEINSYPLSQDALTKGLDKAVQLGLAAGHSGSGGGNAELVNAIDVLRSSIESSLADKLGGGS